MGYDSRNWTVVARLSRHNSERDMNDNELWNELTERLCRVASAPRYERIAVLVDEPDDLDTETYRSCDHIWGIDRRGDVTCVECGRFQ